MTYASMKQAAPAHCVSVNAHRILGTAMLLFLVFGLAGCNKLKARDLLNKGVASFKNGQYDTAIEDFKEARDLDHVLKRRSFRIEIEDRPVGKVEGVRAACPDVERYDA